MVHNFLEYIENIIKVFMDDFTVYRDTVDLYLHNPTLIHERCVETNLILNWEKCYFMVYQ